MIAFEERKNKSVPSFRFEREARFFAVSRIGYFAPTTSASVILPKARSMISCCSLLCCLA